MIGVNGNVIAVDPTLVCTNITATRTFERARHLFHPELLLQQFPLAKQPLAPCESKRVVTFGVRKPRDCALEKRGSKKRHVIPLLPHRCSRPRRPRLPLRQTRHRPRRAAVGRALARCPCRTNRTAATRPPPPIAPLPRRPRPPHRGGVAPTGRRRPQQPRAPPPQRAASPTQARRGDAGCAAAACAARAGASAAGRPAAARPRGARPRTARWQAAPQASPAASAPWIGLRATRAVHGEDL